LGLDGCEAVEHQECDTKMMSAITGHVASGTKFSANQFAPQQRAREGVFVVGVQQSYYNALKAPNHLPRQQSIRSRGNLDYYIRAPPLRTNDVLPRVARAQKPPIDG
jgi:hypothetical protein